MIGVEQIRALEDRIEKALAFISGLRSENAALQAKAEASDEARGRAEDRAAAAESRARELEEAIAVFRRDQSRIEEGILHALEKLDAFEDLVLRGPTAAENEAEALAEAPLTPVQAPSPAAEASRPEAPEVSPGDPAQASARTAAETLFEAAASESPRPGPTRPAVPPPAVDELEIF